MERSGKIPILLAVLLLSRIGAMPCRAQAPRSGSVPLPRAFTEARIPARPFPLLDVKASPAWPRPPAGTSTPTVDPEARRAAQDLPAALPPPAAPPDDQPVAGGLADSAALGPAPAEPGDLRLPINLAAALRLADARPLVVAAAQAGVWVAEAQLTRAKVLWVPSLMFGFDYIRHDGGGPDFNKGIMTAPSTNFFYAGGGMWQMLNVTDAYFEPLVARRVLDARNWDVQAAKNDVLLQTIDAYFEVHRSRGMYAGALYAVGRGHDLIGRISSLSRDLVPRVEVDRARNLVADLEQQATSAREAWRVRSADLTQVLRLDPRAVVVPLERDHLRVTLVDPARPLDDLIPVALTNRPELASHQALVQETLALLRREKVRPLTPSLMINGFQTPNEMIQAGLFGIGPNKSLNQWRGRDDLSYQPLWQLEAFGLGNLARIKEQRGMQSLAIIELFRTQDRIAGDVTRAHARLQSAAARVVQADRALRTAIITFNGGYEGLRQTTRFGDVLTLVNRPQEVVYALQLMKVALDEYFTTVADYNRAQFEVFHALGYPAREVAALRPPGEAVPVDTARPGYLPPVGDGPPPATR